MSDREVAADELRTVEEHLRACRECAFQSSMIVGLKRLLGRWDGVHASERFRVAVLDRVRKEPPPKRINWLPWALGGGLAAVCAVVLALAVALPVSPRRQEPPAANGASAASTEPRRLPPREDVRPVDPPEAPPAVIPTPPPGAASAVPVAQFRTIAKAVQIESPGAFAALAAVGDVVAPGDAVRCPEKGVAKLALLAGLFMRLEDGAHVAFAEGDFDCELRAGRLLLCTKDRAKRPHPYIIRSGAVTVEARDVDRALVASVERPPDGALRILVAEGEAAVVFPGGERTVGRGQAVVFAADGSLSEAPADADAEEVAKLRRWGRP
jgi:hypothetical protein